MNDSLRHTQVYDKRTVGWCLPIVSPCPTYVSTCHIPTGHKERPRAERSRPSASPRWILVIVRAWLSIEVAMVPKAARLACIQSVDSVALPCRAWVARCHVRPSDGRL